MMMLMVPLKDVLCHSIMCTFLSEINSHRSFMHPCTFHLTTSSSSSSSSSLYLPFLTRVQQRLQECLFLLPLNDANTKLGSQL